MTPLVGREAEREILQAAFDSDRSEFVSVYGRRRVGKTFLIRNFFKDKFTFQISGVANVNTPEQLLNFYIALTNTSDKIEFEKKENWLEAFEQLKILIEKSRHKKKVIFFDELPWFDTPKSGFIQALEHFWNDYASARDDIKLITCGSAASWMINKIINNRGGLHNRVTKKIRLEPFTAAECKLLLKKKKINLNNYQIARLYFAFGGVPFYWEEVAKGFSADQNIQHICFSENGLLRNEFKNLFPSLFKKPQKHLEIVRALAKKSKGLTRDEIIKLSGLPNAGSTSRLLNELEESGFIRRYIPFGKKERQSLYQLIDFYTLFYLKFIEKVPASTVNYWLNSFDSPKARTWRGYAFELFNLVHINKIKEALGISGVESSNYSWRSKNPENGAQIDLIIDRKDMVINICEIKFSAGEFTITKAYAENLRNKLSTFITETKTRKTVVLTMISTFGIKQNEHSLGLIQKELVMEDLF